MYVVFHANKLRRSGVLSNQINVQPTLYSKITVYYLWDGREEVLYGDGSACEVSQTNPTPEWEVNGTECYMYVSSVYDLFILPSMKHFKAPVPLTCKYYIYCICTKINPKHHCSYIGTQMIPN